MISSDDIQDELSKCFDTFKDKTDKELTDDIKAIIAIAFERGWDREYFLAILAQILGWEIKEPMIFGLPDKRTH